MVANMNLLIAFVSECWECLWLKQNIIFLHFSQSCLMLTRMNFREYYGLSWNIEKGFLTWDYF